MMWDKFGFNTPEEICKEIDRLYDSFNYDDWIEAESLVQFLAANGVVYGGYLGLRSKKQNVGRAYDRAMKGI